ncbi:MAG: prepilin-type N-terminal cleavage/methylation domain-containing protein, partial [Pseudomonas sp.]|nr:prepilin-type N-terminal cleavage/methylation domain-containing protein [Pseudomonas sp.]
MELLVVVAIIGIIATSATVSFAAGREGARL